MAAGGEGEGAAAGVCARWRWRAAGPQERTRARARGRRCGRGRLAALGLLGAALASGGATLALLWPAVFRAILHRELTLTESSTAFRMWKEPPVPIFIEFFFFNWTNPEELNTPGSQPHLQECGPYVFREVHEKKDVQWNANATVSFWRQRHWFFDAERSGGELSDQITTLNVIALTAAFQTRDWSYLMQTAMSMGIATLGQQLHETHSVGELLFDGFESTLINMAQKLPGLASMDIPFDRFGWFYTRNGSVEADGHFTMHTGVDDVSLLGRLSRWNGASATPFFPGPCGLVNGSAGELFPPGRRRGGSVSMFSPDLCSAFEYVAGAELLDNQEPCFCQGECPPPGALNVSTCRLGAPAFVSYPHFYLADPWYRQQVDGMRPHADSHRNYITIEPTTGIPLDVAARFQINILLQTYNSIGFLNDVPKIYFPMVWFQERISITPELANSLKILLLLPTGGVVIATVIAAIGAIMIAVVALYWIKPTIRWQLEYHGTDIPLKPQDDSKYSKCADREMESKLLQNPKQISG
ncbi:Protein croquemort [Gryllus bimaculatus]|nr:Protein croquemort [Gryllus bimaculatus]